MRKEWMISLFSMLLLFAGPGLAQEGYIQICPHSWNTYNSSAEIKIGTKGLATVEKSVAPGYLYAPVYFPPEADGLFVRQIRVKWYRKYKEQNLYFCLRKVDLYDQGITTVASRESTWDSDSGAWTFFYFNRWMMDARKINNERYAWYIAVYFEGIGPNMQLGFIQIKYAAD